MSNTLNLSMVSIGLVLCVVIILAQYSQSKRANKMKPTTKQPKQTMREFFDREDVRALQDNESSSATSGGKGVTNATKP